MVRDLVCEDAAEDYAPRWRFYGINGVRMTPVKEAETAAGGLHHGRFLAPTLIASCSVADRPHGAMRRSAHHHAHGGGFGSRQPQSSAVLTTARRRLLSLSVKLAAAPWGLV